jgi:NADH-quinone oxidoreductase subunit N
VNAWVHILTLDLGVIALAVAVLLADAFFTIPGRLLGTAIAGTLVLLLLASFFLDLGGVAPHGAYVSDGWVLFFKRLFLVAGTLGVLGSVAWLEARTPRRQAEYYVLLLLSLSGMMLLPGARDWVLLVVLFELMGIPLAVLSAWAKTDGPPGEPRLGPEGGFKLFVTSALSSAMTLFGLGLIVGLTGSTALVSVGPEQLSPLVLLGVLLVMSGLGFKVGAAPFHMWVPDTYQSAPTPFVAFLSVAPKAAGLAALAVVLLVAFGPHRSAWGPALGAVSVASMAIGNFLALPQTDVRRLLAYSGVAQMGYALIALAAGTQQALAMALFFIATYVFTNLGAFLVVHAAAEASGGHQTAKLAGLSRRSPWLGAALLVFLLSLAGIPFVLGFWAKLFVFLAAWRAGATGLVLVGVVLAVLGLFYYLSVARSTFMAEGENPAPVPASLGVRTAIVVCLAAVVGLGLWPGPLVDEASRAASSMLHRP